MAQAGIDFRFWNILIKLIKRKRNWLILQGENTYLMKSSCKFIIAIYLVLGAILKSLNATTGKGKEFDEKWICQSKSRPDKKKAN